MADIFRLIQLPTYMRQTRPFPFLPDLSFLISSTKIPINEKINYSLKEKLYAFHISHPQWKSPTPKAILEIYFECGFEAFLHYWHNVKIDNKLIHICWNELSRSVLNKLFLAHMSAYVYIVLHTYFGKHCLCSFVWIFVEAPPPTGLSCEPTGSPGLLVGPFWLKAPFNRQPLY